MPTNDPRPSKNQKRDEAREKARLMRIEQERKAKRTRIIIIAFTAVIIVALGTAIGFILKSNSDKAETYASVAYGGGGDDVVAPTDAKAPSTADGHFIPVSKAGVGKAGAGDTTLSVYFDLQCPVCAQFDSINGADLDALAAEDGITVKYFPVSFLDQMSNGTFYSSRASNAASIVADKDPEHFSPFITALYTQQPAENTDGLTDAAIADIATDAGVPTAVSDTFTDTVDGTYKVNGSDAEKSGTWRTFSPWMASNSAEFGVLFPKGGTPTVLIDDKVFKGNWQTPGELKTAVEAAAAAK